MTHYLRKFGIAGKRDTKLPTKARYLAALNKAKRAVMRASETELDNIIGSFKRRLRSYDRAQWNVATISTKEVGVWKGAGGLPIAWTKGSLAQTATFVRRGLKVATPEIHARAKRALPAIALLKTIMVRDPYLYLIVFESEYGTKGRNGLKKMRGDIDDGNMRAIAYAVSGTENLRVYFGKKPR